MSSDTAPSHAGLSPTEGIHGIVAGTIASESDMVAGTITGDPSGTRTVDAQDVSSGKLFLRSDTGTMVRYTNHSPVRVCPVDGALSRTCAAWAADDSVLPIGAWGIESDTGLVKIGDGVSPWNSLNYEGVIANEEAIFPGGTNVVNVQHCQAFTGGTVSHPVPASTSVKARTRRFTVTSTATTGALAEVRFATPDCWRGDAAGLGGFRLEAVFGFDSAPATRRAAIGFENIATGATNVDPLASTTYAKIQCAINEASTNWAIIHNTQGSAPTVIDLGASFPVDTTTLYRMVLVAPPNAASVYYRVENLSTPAVASGALTTNLPASANFLAAKFWATPNATAAAIAPTCGRMRLTPLGL